MSIGNKLMINHKGFIFFFGYEEVLFLKSDNCYTNIYLKDGNEFLMIKSLAKLEREINDKSFIRVNQSYLINKTHIVTIDKKNKNIVLTADRNVPFTITLKKLLELINE